MPKVFAFSIGAFILMIGVAGFASLQTKSDREPASATQGVQMPNNFYHSAKY